MEENKMTYILGINSAYHESAACLIKDGEMVAAAEEERFNRIKHAKPSQVDNADQLPIGAIDFCLKQAGISLAQVEYVGYSLNPEERLKRNTQCEHSYDVTPGDFGTEHGEQMFHDKIGEVEKKLKQGGFRGEFHYLNHHDCHAASSFLVSSYDEAAVLVIDGIGEFESTTLYKGEGNKLEKIGSIDFPNSLGFLWEKISKYLGFSEYDAAKVMGLSAYGSPEVFKEQFKQLVRVEDDGTFAVDDDLIMFRNENYSGLEGLFGVEKRNEPVKDVDETNRQYANLASSLQELTNEIVLKLAGSLKEKTGSKHLCLSGGVALNCVANTALLRSGIFEDVFVQPASNDAGTAIGASYFIWNQLLDRPRGYVFDSPYMGPSFSDEEMKEALEKNGLSYESVDDIETAAAKLVADGAIVAWFQGAMEIGPRALGNRTLLADPRNKNVRALLNKKVKHREPFRPFCPSVLEERAKDWFDIGEGIPSPARYMIGAFDALADKRDSISAVVHADGTSRIQAVSKETNPKYHRLIEEFERLTGVPLVLNTSFNDQEPIVCTPQDAINTFLKTKIDCLVMGDFLVRKGDGNEE
jgi:carbamoyltransferase